MHILLIDDHELFRLGLRTSLQEFDNEITLSEAGTIACAKDAIEKNHLGIDLVLLDQILPDGRGLELLKHIRQRYPLLPVAMLSAEENTMLMRQSLEWGAQGYIPKSTCADILLSAINLILSGGTYIPPNLLASLGVLQYSPFTTNVDTGDLTPRQHEVLKLVNQGLSNKAIADQLNISEATVKAHVTSILKTRGMHSRKLLIASGC